MAGMTARGSPHDSLQLSAFSLQPRAASVSGWAGLKSVVTWSAEEKRDQAEGWRL